jgi:23S rRNA (adenine2503-C2)-methyltransferase
MQISDIRRRLAALGAKAGHIDRILRAWTRLQALDTKRQKADSFFPRPVREEIPRLFAELEGLVRLHSEHPGADGSARLLVELADGQKVESVLLPRDGLCVSTQVGCAVACQFCMTGQSGLIRQLSSAEIVAQVVLARKKRTVRRVVFMGMGEPAHNLDNVLEAIDLLGTIAEIGHKNLVFSTVGDRRVFERLPLGTVKPALALSLHTTQAALRQRLLPNAPVLTPDELVELGERYARQTGYPIQYQWTLLEGINDSDAEVDGIIRLLKGKYAMMNFIPYNSNEGMGFRRPTAERAATMAGMLHQSGILSRLRDSAGQDVDGGCGQLRARAELPAHKQHKLTQKQIVTKQSCEAR